MKTAQSHLLATASNWRDAAEEARYLLDLFAATLAAQDRPGQTLIAGVLADPRAAFSDQSYSGTHNRGEDKMAKGQLRSNREKKKPKAERNKKKSAPAVSPFTPTRLTGKSGAGRKFS